MKILKNYSADKIFSLPWSFSSARKTKSFKMENERVGYYLQPQVVFHVATSNAIALSRKTAQAHLHLEKQHIKV